MRKRPFQGDTSKLLTFCKTHLDHHKRLLITLNLLIILGAVLTNLYPTVYGRLVDIIYVKHTKDFYLYLAIYFVISILSSVFAKMEQYIGNVCSLVIVNDIKSDVYRRIVCFKQKVHDQFTPGYFFSRIQSDADQVVTFCVDWITGIVMIVVNSVLATFMILYISRILSVTAIILVVANAVIFICFKHKIREVAKKALEVNDRFFSFLSESLGNLLGIKAFQLEKMASERFDGLQKEQVKVNKKSLQIVMKKQMAIDGMNVIFNIAVMYLAYLLIGNGDLSVGEFISFNLYVERLIEVISGIQGLKQSQQTAFVSMERLTELNELPLEEELNDRYTNKANELVKDENSYVPSIRINHLSFGYGQQDILKDICLDIKKPGFYSLVGKNGCGKTTLLKLLIHLYEPTGGVIEIDGTKISEKSVVDLRKQITFIQKDTFILDDTIWNNLKLADGELTYEQAAQACKRVGLHDYIMQLPKGYETILGERGGVLSSGLKQKLSFVRAILKHSSIILLDEITSDLDGSAEQDIMTILKELAKEKIILSISHRLTAITQSDCIYVLDGGTIVCSGKHEILVEESAIYQSLFRNLNESK